MENTTILLYFIHVVVVPCLYFVEVVFNEDYPNAILFII